jgi:hypothetical protein
MKHRPGESVSRCYADPVLIFSSLTHVVVLKTNLWVSSRFDKLAGYLHFTLFSLDQLWGMHYEVDMLSPRLLPHEIREPIPTSLFQPEGRMP